MSAGSGELSSRPAAEAYLARVCFKVGPPALIGAELEWFTRTRSGDRPSLASIADALGPYTPHTLAPPTDQHRPDLALPSGNVVSVEPGGQIELSSAPATGIAAVIDALREDQERLSDLLARRGITLVAGGADAEREPHRLLTLPRYCAMERRFDTNGPFGRLMMCNTAAVQVSVDAGRDARQIGQRWDTLHAVGPALLAAFAATPDLYGVHDQRWASQRMRAWFELDRTRTRVPLGADRMGVDPIADYARWIMDVPLLCVRRDGVLSTPPREATFAEWLEGDLDDVLGRRPTTADLDYHVTTVFPLVRASGHLEVRYLDGQPDGQWDVPMYVVEAILANDAVAARARDLVSDTVNRWEDAARDGLADHDLRVAAVDVLTLAADTSSGVARERVGRAAQRCRSGAAPGERDEARREFSR